MPKPSYYDLVVLLDPEAPEERRAQLIEQIKGQIDSGQAALKGDADWGMRRLAFEIDHRREAQYHLFQFEAASEVLTQLDRSLSIDDSVLRHRIIRLPGEPPETTPKPPEDAPRRQTEERPAEERPEPGEQAEAEQPAPETAEQPAAEAAPEAATEPAAEVPTEAPAEVSTEPPAEASTEAAPEPAQPESPPAPPAAEAEEQA